MRRAHYLKRNHGTEVPCHAIFFDTETVGDTSPDGVLTHVLSFGMACYVRKHRHGKWTKPKWIRFTTADQFVDFVISCTKPRIKLYLYCHNTSFDIPVLNLFNNLIARGFVLTMACIDAPPTICKFREGTGDWVDDHTKPPGTLKPEIKSGGCTIVILDTLNHFRMPLKMLGSSIGLDKLEPPQNMLPSSYGDKYCKRDVEIILTATLKWYDFIKDNDLGGYASTLAGQAMRSFRHRFMKHEILIDNNEEATRVSRQSYYGGRTECFRIGKFSNRLTLLDLNSMYPAVMFNNTYPTRLVQFKRGHIRDRDHARWADKLVCARVTIDTSEPIYPLRTKSALLFPTGRFTTFLSSPELRHAQKHGHIVQYHETAVYDHAQIFTNKRIEAQHEGRTVDALLLKLMGNSLYGKTGQRGRFWENIGWTDDLTCKNDETLHAQTGETFRTRQLGGLIQELTNKEESKDSFPAIASHVTSYARLLLWDMINTAGRDNVYYVDTDSLLVTDTGLYNLTNHLDQFALGKLKVEGTYNDCEIFGAKDYRFGTKERHKGVKANALWTSCNTVNQQQWSSLRGLIKTGSISAPTTRQISKRLSRVYNKGKVSEAGNIKPFKLRGDTRNDLLTICPTTQPLTRKSKGTSS